MADTILIVEDESAIAETIQYALETEGFHTACLMEGRPLMAYLERHAVALIILDIGLPDINGLELCKRIRTRHDTPIIFLTARDHEIDRVVGLEIGGDDYVTKPFSPRELTARVKAVLRRRPSAPAPPPLTPFRLDPVKRRIRYFDHLLDLSRYEFDLLATLIARPGQVFTREQLMARVWDAPEASMDRTVDAHIKNLRAKLKAVHPDIDPIVTHRGLGYALKEEI
ncbi:MAG: two-component system response regulator CreB [Desulfobacterales bacterium]|jgi:two-component system catabolic regulation response regulator CreB